jgi:hypothetical protein
MSEATRQSRIFVRPRFSEACPLRFAREPCSTNRPLDDLSLFRWCGQEDSNFHGLSPTTTSTLRVYQFRHGRTAISCRVKDSGVGARL